MKLSLLSLVGAASFLVACGGGEETTTTSTTSTTYTNTTTSNTTGTTSTGSGFTVEGTALNLLDFSPIGLTGLCIYASDPTAAITGGKIEILAGSTIEADGSYEVNGIETTSMLGILMLIEDCDGGGSVMPTATGIAFDTYNGLGDGDVLNDINSYAIDGDSLAAFSAGLGAAGYTGDLTVDGALVGFVLGADGTPVDDATIIGHEDYPTYYFTGVGFDGASTSAVAGSLFVTPAAPIYTYECEADGYTFDSILAGSQPGYAVLVTFDAI